MNDQLRFPDPPSEHGIQARFERFHAKHPDVYDELLRVCRVWKRHSSLRWSVDAAYQIIRWERVIAGLSDPHEAYKLNDHYRSRYSRLLMRENPELEGLFKLRELRS